MNDPKIKKTQIQNDDMLDKIHSEEVIGGDSTENTSDHVSELQNKCDEYLQGWQRAKADYQNFKREIEKRNDETVKFANSYLLAEVIPVYDNFKKAFACSPKSQDKEWVNWQSGIGYIQKQMWDFISKFGVAEIKTLGEVFNPMLHESVGSEKSSEFMTGVIVREVQSGYTLHGRLLTPARVIVAE